MDSEAYGDAYGDAESYGDEDSYGDADAYGEETRADRERRRRARIALARRRSAERGRARPRPLPTPGGPSPRAAISAVRDLDLETKVTEDRLRGRLAGQSQRMSRAEYAATAGAVVDQFFDSFGGPENTFLRAGLRFAPLLLLKPERRGTGVESVITDPRVLAAAAIAGVAFFGDNHKKSTSARRIQIQARDTLTQNSSGLAVASITDNAGNPLNVTLVWTSSDPGIATVSPISATTARITAGDNTGDVVITATADKISADTIVTVVSQWDLTARVTDDPPAPAAASGGKRKPGADGTPA